MPAVDAPTVVGAAGRLGGEDSSCCGAPAALQGAVYRRATDPERRCCVVAWWARLGAAVHSSDGEDEFGEGLRDPMPRIDVGGQFVMTAVEILHAPAAGWSSLWWGGWAFWLLRRSTMLDHSRS